MDRVLKRAKAGLTIFIADVKGIWLPLVILAIYFVATSILFGTVCPFRIILGKYCPGCGLTRGCIMVLTGQWKRAIEYNATSFAWVLLIWWLLMQRYVLQWKKLHWELPVIVVGIGTIANYLLYIV